MPLISDDLLELPKLLLRAAGAFWVCLLFGGVRGSCPGEVPATDVQNKERRTQTQRANFEMRAAHATRLLTPFVLVLSFVCVCACASLFFFWGLGDTQSPWAEAPTPRATVHVSGPPICLRAKSSNRLNIIPDHRWAGQLGVYIPAATCNPMTVRGSFWRE